MANEEGDLKPLVSFYFKVDLNEEEISFQEVTGLEASLEVEEVQEGGKSIPHRLPVRFKYGNIKLSRGLIKDDDSKFLAWLHSSFADGVINSDFHKQLLDFEISLLNPTDGSEMDTWLVYGAYPVKWSGPTLNSLDNKVAIEQIELAVRSISKVD